MKPTKTQERYSKASAKALKNMKSFDYECFERHAQYMSKKGYQECIPEWWAMYEGRQTPENYDSELPRATENITSWVIDSQHATILGTTVTLNFTCFDKNLSTDGLKKFDEYVQKAIGMEEQKDDLVLDALVASAGLLYHYWSDDALTFRGNNKGSLGVDTVALEDFFCSNPRLRDIQRQKYVGFRHRAEVKAVRATVSKKMKNYKEIIASIVPDDYLDHQNEYDTDDSSFEAGTVTLYTRFFRIDDEVYWTRSTKCVQLCEPIALNPSITGKKLKLKEEYEENGYAPDDDEIYELDPEVPNFQDEKLEPATEESHAKEKDKMSYYPISILVLRRRRNCLYGRSIVEDVYDNQKLVNFMTAMVAKEIQDTAWATIIMKEGAANGQTWTGQPGGVFTDYTPGNNFVIKRLEGNQLNAQVMNYVSTIIDITKMITGTNELVDSSSNLKDVTAYALQILEEQRNKKIEALQNRYWRFLVECAKIRLQFYKHYYPKSYYIYDLKILITCNIPYKDDLNLELDKCVLLNTYLNDYFLNNKLISSYEIIYCAYNYNDNKDLFINEKSIQQKVLKNLNSGWSYSLTNTLYINDLVKINIDDGPKVKDEDKKGDYYVYDYYFTKLSKNLRKESEE